MKENKYDDEKFFHQYSQMSRSVDGLKGAGEWHVLQKMLPDFQGKRVLDLGCGFGWHCQYAIEHGAVHALGIDLSHKMLEEATKRNNSPHIEYSKNRSTFSGSNFAHPRVMTLSSALLPFIIWNHFRIFARRYTDASLPGEPLFSLSSIPCLQLTVVKTGSMTNKETYSTGRWTAISRKENERPFSWAKT